MPRLALTLATLLVAATPARAQSLDILFSFGGSIGAAPQGGVVLDSAGNLLGTTSSGGSTNRGTVFRLSDNGAGGYTHSTLLNFNNTNGREPLAGLAMDAACNLYGTTQLSNPGSGTVFRLSDNKMGGYTHSILFTFSGSTGTMPRSTLATDATGNLYGTTFAGGANNLGTVFRLSPNGGGGYSQSTLMNFSVTTGQLPQRGVVIDDAGNIYGTTLTGGTSGFGTVFKLSDNGAGGYNYSTILNFNGSNGRDPYSRLIFDDVGNLYGTTAAGGLNGRGTVFRLSDNGLGGYNHSILYSLNDGRAPIGGLIRDAVGNLFGTTQFGGASDAGTIYRLGSGPISDLHRLGSM